jgi:hypothetical protein
MGISRFPIRPGVDLRNINSASPEGHFSSTGNVALPVPDKINALAALHCQRGHAVSNPRPDAPLVRRDLLRRGQFDHCTCDSDAGFRPFPDSPKNAPRKTGGYTREEGMSRFTVGLLIVACLMLTAYFGAAAWRTSDDNQMDITGRIGPAAK